MFCCSIFVLCLVWGIDLHTKFSTVILTLWNRFLKEAIFNLVSFAKKDVKICTSVMK